MRHSKIAIIGAGNVGATCAYALILKSIASEILLVDINEDRCEGEVRDLSDALPFSQCSQVKRVSFKEAGQADIIVITAGASQKLGQTRLDLLDTNKKIIESIIKEMSPIQSRAVLLMVTNPVDVLAMHAQKVSELPHHQVIGSGTLLDTQRLRGYLSEQLHIAERSVHAYILGEHGNSQFVCWSRSTVVGTPITQFIPKQELSELAENAMNEAYEIIRCKGSTYYGISACVSEICENILFNQKRVMPISSYHKDLGVYLSLPTVLGENGVEHVIPVEFSEEEKAQLMRSVKALKQL